MSAIFVCTPQFSGWVDGPRDRPIAVVTRGAGHTEIRVLANVFRYIADRAVRTAKESA